MRRCGGIQDGSWDEEQCNRIRLIIGRNENRYVGLVVVLGCGVVGCGCGGLVGCGVVVGCVSESVCERTELC